MQHGGAVGLLPAAVQGGVGTLRVQQQQQRPQQQRPQQQARDAARGAAHTAAAGTVQATTESIAAAAAAAAAASGSTEATTTVVSSDAATAAHADTDAAAAAAAAVATAVAAVTGVEWELDAGLCGEPSNTQEHQAQCFVLQQKQSLRQMRQVQPLKTQQQRGQLLKQHQLYVGIVFERLFRVLQRSAYRRPWRQLLVHAAQQHVLQHQQQPLLLQEMQHRHLDCREWGDQTAADLQGLSNAEEACNRDTCMRLDGYQRRLQQQQQWRKQQQQQQKQQQQQLLRQLATATQELRKANDQQEILQGRLASALIKLSRFEQQQQQQQHHPPRAFV